METPHATAIAPNEIKKIEITDNLTLEQLMMVADQSEQVLDMYSPEELELLGVFLRSKVDSWWEHIDDAKWEEKKFKERASLHTTEAGYAKNRHLGKLSFIKWLMKRLGWEVISGEMYKFALNTKKNDVLEITSEPTEHDYLKIPQFVNIKYEWNKAALTEAWKQHLLAEEEEARAFEEDREPEVFRDEAMEFLIGRMYLRDKDTLKAGVVKKVAPKKKGKK